MRATNAACISRSKSLRLKSFATCARSGLDLQPRVDSKLLRFEAARPSLFGLEMHLARMYREIEEFAPAAVVIDPISALRGDSGDVHAMLLRIIDLLKSKGITAFLTNLLADEGRMDAADAGVSSLMDTWISLVQLESNGERNPRTLYVLEIQRYESFQSDSRISVDLAGRQTGRRLSRKRRHADRLGAYHARGHR